MQTFVSHHSPLNMDKITTPAHFSPAYRVRKAYATAFRVMGSYVWLSFCRRWMGRRWYEARIQDLHIRNAERVKNTILDLQGLFIKIGQMLSILSNFLPEAFQKPLEALQDKLPARPYHEVSQRIETELGKKPEELFAEFNPEPLATASIGQAHQATLADGTRVIVKVQHYGIESVATVDLDIIQKLTRLITWFMDIRGMDYLYSQIRKMIEEELDFSNEARSMDIIRKNLEGEKGVLIPVIHPAYSSGRVLTTTFHQGIKISDVAGLERFQIDRKELAARMTRIWCLMILKDGFYHADPHPGNLLVEENGDLVLLDFGATATLPPQMREGISSLIEAAVKNDTEDMIDACRKMGFLADGPDAEKVARKMIVALRNFLQNEVQFEGLNFKDIKIIPFNNSLTGLIQDIGFKGIAGTVQIPKEYVLLNRAITLLLGISNTIAPAFNPLEVVRPYMQEFILAQKGGALGYVRDFVQRTLTTTLSLPDELQKTIRKTRSGELEIRSPDIIASARMVARAIRKLVFAVLAIGLAFFSLQLWEMGWQHQAQWGWGLAGILLLGAVWRK